MKQYFGWYYRPTTEEFKALWAEGTFVFDTNVLLTLYRYPARLRDVFLSVIGKISDRIWIPYQVGLEFHRNKFIRIRAENNKVSDILREIDEYGKKIIENAEKLTSNNVNAGLNAEDINGQIEAFRAAHKAICTVVSAAKENLPENDLNDTIGIRISELFDGKVGAPPTSQEELDKIYSEGDSRYENKIPPGFKDKNPKDESFFYDGQLLYKNKYGDLLLWKQTIAYAKKENKKKLIFVTDDSKPDWWDADGHLTRGPLPALLREMRVEGGVDVFWIYKSDQFLKFAEEYLQAHEVTDEAVEQVKGISENSASDAQEMASVTSSHYLLPSPSQPGGMMDFVAGDAHRVSWSPHIHGMASVSHIGFIAEQAVYSWLVAMFPGSVFINNNFPDFLVDTGVAFSGYEVRYIKDLAKFPLMNRIKDVIYRSERRVSRGEFSDLTIVIVSDKEQAFNISDRVLASLHRMVGSSEGISIVIGFVQDAVFKDVLFIRGAKGAVSNVGIHPT